LENLQQYFEENKEAQSYVALIDVGGNAKVRGG
jgi:hypothetical protein